MRVQNEKVVLGDRTGEVLLPAVSRGRTVQAVPGSEGSAQVRNHGRGSAVHGCVVGTARLDVAHRAAA